MVNAELRRRMMKAAASRFMPNIRGFGPYLLIELLLPGGTLIALLLWISQGMTRSGLLGVHQPTVNPSSVECVVTPLKPDHVLMGARA
jgi:hypothetical protein